MTYLQGVFSLHAIFCYFYGGVTFFNTDLTVKMGLSRKLHTEPASPFLAQTRCLAALSEAPRLSSVRFTRQSISLTLPRPSLPSDPEWSGQQYTVLMKMHGACVLGLGLVCISAAQFDEAESRCGRSTTSHTPFASCRLHEDVHLLLCCNAAHRSPSPCPLPTYPPSPGNYLHWIWLTRRWLPSTDVVGLVREERARAAESMTGTSQLCN
jgi:hypothetical protein